MKKNIMLLQYKKLVLVPEVDTKAAEPSLYTLALLVKNAKELGYAFSEAVLTKLLDLSQDSLTKWGNETLSMLAQMKGLRHNMTGFYHSPQDTLEKTMEELWIDKFLNVITGFTYLPSSVETSLNISDDFHEYDNLETLGLASNEDYLKLFTEFLGSKSALSASMKSDVCYILNNDNISGYIPEVIPNKENFGYILGYVYKVYGGKSEKTLELLKTVKTATDVLRFVFAVMGNDVSLSHKETIKSMSKDLQRLTVKLLEENCNGILEDMNRQKIRWIRVFERIHVKMSSKVKDAITTLRSGASIKTFANSLDKAYKENNLELILELLSSRPGEFARNLNRVLCLDNSPEEFQKIFDAWEEVAPKVETKLLLTLIPYFRSRTEVTKRVFIPKGNMMKAYVMDANLKAMDGDICDEVVRIISNSLIKVYAEKSSLGKVYISDSVNGFVVPTVLRAASNSVHTVAPGSRLNIDESARFVRLFTHWEETEEQRYVDLDLSAVFIIEDEDGEFDVPFTLDYTSMKNYEYNVAHSGDVRRAPHGVGGNEYVDIDLDTCKENNIKYIACTLHSFTSEHFYELEECFMGYMVRENINDGQCFEPASVKMKLDVSCDSSSALPFVIDVESRQIIWMDMSLAHNGIFSTARGSRNNILYALMGIIKKPQMNFREFAEMQVSARGTLVDNPEDADLLIALDSSEFDTTLEKSIVTPYDAPLLLSEWV